MIKSDLNKHLKEWAQKCLYLFIMSRNLSSFGLLSNVILMHFIKLKSFVHSSVYIGQIQTIWNSSSISFKLHNEHSPFSMYLPISICSG